jgi:adenine-specific DNA methylase
MGIGNFFARMPEELSKVSDLIGIEKNVISGRMAQALYPDAKIVVKPYEQVQLPNNSVDLIIGNPPFADIKITDPLYKNPKLSVHNYFIVKSLDKLKPGAVAAVITSHYTLDSQSMRARDEMFARADLVAAIRLPDTAFKENAGTRVTADSHLQFPGLNPQYVPRHYQAASVCSEPKARPQAHSVGFPPVKNDVAIPVKPTKALRQSSFNIS